MLENSVKNNINNDINEIFNEHKDKIIDQLNFLIEKYNQNYENKIEDKNNQIDCLNKRIIQLGEKIEVLSTENANLISEIMYLKENTEVNGFVINYKLFSDLCNKLYYTDSVLYSQLINEVKDQEKNRVNTTKLKDSSFINESNETKKQPIKDNKYVLLKERINNIINELFPEDVDNIQEYFTKHQDFADELLTDIIDSFIDSDKQNINSEINSFKKNNKFIDNKLKQKDLKKYNGKDLIKGLKDSTFYKKNLYKDNPYKNFFN